MLFRSGTCDAPSKQVAQRGVQAEDAVEIELDSEEDPQPQGLCGLTGRMQLFDRLFNNKQNQQKQEAAPIAPTTTTGSTSGGEQRYSTVFLAFDD